MSSESLGEFEIIARYFAPLAQTTPGAFGLIDDAASLTPAEGNDLVLTTDMLVAGVHFRREDEAQDVAWKALAVNVSDLVAKGAEPLVYLLALALPKPADPDWLQGLAAGLRAAQEAFGCGLAGGDTTATDGPVTLSITAIGQVPKDQMLRRAGAKVGDTVYVSGTIGDAALGLRLLTEPACARRWGLDAEQAAALRARYWRPEPPLALVSALRAHASAAMDISDGLVGDLRKLCAASNVAAEIRADAVPLSQAAQVVRQREPELLETILTGGDDYEVLATVPGDRCQSFEAAARAVSMPVARIGQVFEGEGVKALSAEGAELHLGRDSYKHF